MNINVITILYNASVAATTQQDIVTFLPTGQLATPPVTFCSAAFRLAEFIPTHALCMVSYTQ